MNTFIVIHPENLFVEHVDSLKDPNNKFIICFHNIINIATEFKSKVLFSNNLVGAFWSHPPWSDINSDILDVQIRRSLQSQIYPFFTKYLNNHTDTTNLDPCESNPDLVFFDEDTLEETKKIITSTKKYLGSIFISNSNQKYHFIHSGENLNIKSVSSLNDLFDQIESFVKWWPQSKKEILKFDDCLNVYWKKNGVKPIYKYKFSENFLADFLKTKNFKDDIIDKIGLRLSMSLQNASKYPLKDEAVGNGKERRFRVTQRPSSTRIHYSFDKNEIIFERFYDEGHHDDGLR